MKSKRSIRGLGLALLIVAVAGLAGLAYAAGTSLTVSLGDADVECNEDATGSVTIPYMVTSTAAADAAAVTGQIDGGEWFDITTIPSGNVNGGGGWTFVGRVKTFSGTINTTLDAGSHSVTVCAAQHGSDRKSDCDSQTITVDCQPPVACGGTTLSGGLGANKNLCSSEGVIEVDFQGDLGATANLTIMDLSGFSYSTTVPRVGNTCTYHYDWHPGSTGNGGAGTYIFVITAGAGGTGTLFIIQDLTCQPPS